MFAVEVHPDTSEHFWEYSQGIACEECSSSSTGKRLGDPGFQQAIAYCQNCGQHMCVECDRVAHSQAAKAFHPRTTLLKPEALTTIRMTADASSSNIPKERSLALFLEQLDRIFEAGVDVNSSCHGEASSDDEFDVDQHFDNSNLAFDDDDEEVDVDMHNPDLYSYGPRRRGSGGRPRKDSDGDQFADWDVSGGFSGDRCRSPSAVMTLGSPPRNPPVISSPSTLGRRIDAVSPPSPKSPRISTSSLSRSSPTPNTSPPSMHLISKFSVDSLVATEIAVSIDAVRQEQVIFSSFAASCG